MNKLLIVSALFLLGGCAKQNIIQNEITSVKTVSKEDAIKEDAIVKIDGFINSVKPILMSSLKSDPTGNSGMDICSAMAQTMTKDYNKALPSNIKIRRTALKYRNILNKPNDLDKKVMNDIIASKTMAPVMVETKKSYLVYKPLSNMQPCLACHGDLKTMDPKTVSKIKKYYPKDLANGFKLNDFRGVVVAEIKK
jgi:hypothetical protein